jgi:hypothetical protein
MIMRLNELRGPGDEALTFEAWRMRLARLLMWASAALTRAAVAVGGFRRKQRPELEFYAEAGAPEGALYADGERVGTLQGITRL